MNFARLGSGLLIALSLIAASCGSPRHPDSVARSADGAAPSGASPASFALAHPPASSAPPTAVAAPAARVTPSSMPPGTAAPIAAPPTPLPSPLVVTNPAAAYIDESTLAVVRIDVAALDLDAIGAWAGDALKGMGLPHEDLDAATRLIFRQALPRARKWSADFVTAGGKSIYLFAMVGSPPPVFAVIPLPPASDGKAMQAVAREVADAAFPAAADAIPRTVYLSKSAVVICDAAIPRRLRNIEPTTRPELEQALRATAGAPIAMAYSLPEAARGLLLLRAPRLPPELGGGSMLPVSHDLRWAAIYITPPPAAAVGVTLQAKDADSARKLRGIIDASHASLAREAAQIPNLDWVLAALRPEITGDRLELTLDSPKITRLASTAGTALVLARQQTARIASSRNMRQLMLATQIFALNHEGAMPTRMPEDLREYLGNSTADLWLNPRRPQLPDGYVYLRPRQPLSMVHSPATTIVLYEAFSDWEEGINVAFADGHVEFIKVQSEFARQLKISAAAATTAPASTK